MAEREPALVLGVDGGNSKTVAIVATRAGKVRGAGRADGSDIYNAESEKAALAEVRRAVEAALGQAGATPADLAASTFSLAGADWPEDITLLCEAIGQFGFVREYRVVNDAIGALRAGTPDGVGVVVTCGTGIAIGAQNAQGEVWYSGHWPVAYGGFELGNAALRAVYEAELGLGPQTSLTGAVIAFFAVETVSDVLHRCTARQSGWCFRMVAKLAPILLDEAAKGDAVACDIVHRAGQRNADMAITAARALDLHAAPFRLVLSGGVLRHPSGLLRKAISARIAEATPFAETVPDPPEPVVGAVLLAIDLLGDLAPQSARDRLFATLPGPELFET
jgi:N-acetylglucosamine kinase-like BadF-type ATPase